jgi:hypothetical protein
MRGNEKEFWMIDNVNIRADWHVVQLKAKPGHITDKPGHRVYIKNS